MAQQGGQEIYAKECSKCHGEKGYGDGPSSEGMFPPPSDLVAGQFKFDSTSRGTYSTDEDLFRMAAKGLPGTSMPPWEMVLTEKEINDVVAHIKTLSPRSRMQGRPIAIPPGPASTTRGEQVYREAKCALCHGKEGRGDGPITETLFRQWGQPFSARDLTRGWVFRGGHRPEDIYIHISEGLDATPMAAYRRLGLTDQERWDLAHYVASLEAEPSDDEETSDPEEKNLPPWEKAWISRFRSPLSNPYGRNKHGPPLTNIFHKAGPSWIFRKLSDPKHHPSARMPDFGFKEEEVLDVMAYLKGIADSLPPVVAWPIWVDKDLRKMNGKEREEANHRVEEGKRLWEESGCITCHKIRGAQGESVGGEIDLRTGGIDLHGAGDKLQRDWLFSWLKEPMSYFPSTLMPHYRFSDEEVKSLAEYLLRDPSFRSAEEDASRETPVLEELDRPERVKRGHRIIERSRCTVCHEIKGIDSFLQSRTLNQGEMQMAERFRCTTCHDIGRNPYQNGSMEHLIQGLRCMTCHAIGGWGGSYAAPLAGEESRLTKEEIERYLSTSGPGRSFPHRFKLSKKESEDLADFLGECR
jgi:mono/diheme cytochrome c family protein